jgi:hypothetical protein
MKPDNQPGKGSESRTEANPNTDRLEEIRPCLWEEIVGQCLNAHRDAEEVSLTLKVKGKAVRVVIPAPNENSLLSELIGQRLGILRTDDQARPFVVRKT